MPRDLSYEAGQDTLNSMAPLQTQNGRNTSRSKDALKIYPKNLTLQDVDACCILEDAAFPPNQRCSREKFNYRIKNCPELCMGLFTTADDNYDSHHFEEAATAKSGAQVETGSTRKHVLIAHAIGTLSNQPTVTDDDMTLPTPGAPSHIGHQPGGQTICLHSLAVLPDYQGRGIGTTLLRSFVQRLRDAHTYKRIALLADSDHVDFYLKEGFRNVGSSKATFGETAWSDMVLSFSSSQDDD